MPTNGKFTKPDVDNQAGWDYPTPDYTRILPKPPAGTVVVHPVPKLENGRSSIERNNYFVVDDNGRLHQIFEFELTDAERGARKVRDPARRDLLFDHYRNRRSAEDPMPDEFAELLGGDGRPTPGAMVKLAAMLGRKMAMPTNVLVQREPGEEG